MASVRVHFIPGFLSGEEYSQNNPIIEKNGFLSENVHLCGKITLRQSSPLRTGFPLEEPHFTVPPRKQRSKEELIWSSRTALDQFSPQKSYS
jgi:hypothetical protein